METIYESLKLEGLLKRGKVQSEVAEKLPFKDLLDLVDAVAMSTTAPPQGRTSHVAAIALGGGHSECRGLSCRRQKVLGLSRFAALYSQGVTIHNFFADYSPTLGHIPKKDTLEFRRAFIRDLSVLNDLKPMVDQGIVTLYTPNRVACPHCVSKELLGSKGHTRFKTVWKKLKQDYLENLDVWLEWRSNKFAFRCEGPPEYLEHSPFYRYPREQPPTKRFPKPRLLSRARGGERVPLTKANRRLARIHEYYAVDTFRSVFYQLAVSQSLGTSFLTHRPLDLRLLAEMTNEEEVDQKNRSILENLDVLVPFLDDVPTKQLVELRKKEGPAFIRFRAKLSQLVEEARNAGPLSKREAANLYSDVIEPELAILDQRIASARRSFLKTPLTSSVGAVGVIAFGFFTGLLPAELASAAKTLGLYQLTKDTVTELAAKADTKSGIRDHEMYYLWRVRQKAEL